MSVVVVATFLPLPEHYDEVVAALEHAIERVHAEDEGCELYALNSGLDRLVMVEKWASQEALAAHAKNPALIELSAAIDGKLHRGPDVQVLKAHPAGTPELGVL